MMELPSRIAMTGVETPSSKEWRFVGWPVSASLSETVSLVVQKADFTVRSVQCFQHDEIIHPRVPEHSSVIF